MTGGSTRLSDAAALFQIAHEQGCASLHVKTSNLEVFVSFQKGVANPMAARPVTAATPPAADGSKAEETGTWAAPHLATLIAIADVGAPIASGETFARIELLGEEIAVKADRDAIIAHHLASSGTLLEFDTPIVAWRGDLVR